jgi:hypothetical protein
LTWSILVAIMQLRSNASKNLRLVDRQGDYS